MFIPKNINSVWVNFILFLRFVLRKFNSSKNTLLGSLFNMEIHINFYCLILE